MGGIEGLANQDSRVHQLDAEGVGVVTMTGVRPKERNRRKHETAGAEKEEAAVYFTCPGGLKRSLPFPIERLLLVMCVSQLPNSCTRFVRILTVHTDEVTSI